ncbi:MAG: hypothetical protein ACKO96_18290, partial [Flammeovirgaceae bacterium]
GVLCIIEARYNGVNIIEFENWKQKYKQKYEVFDAGLNEDEFISKAIEVSGSGYDFSLIASHARDAIKKGQQLLINNESRYTCSELTATFLGLHRPQQYKPIDIYNHLIKK